MNPIHAELLDLARAQDGLTPSAVLDAATPEDSVLHDRFTWDDSIAGHKYRLGQARQLIRVFKITVDTADERVVRVRAFTSMPDDDGARRYRPTDEQMATSEGRQVILQQAVREIAALKKKYNGLIDFDTVLKAALRAEDAA